MSKLHTRKGSVKTCSWRRFLSCAIVTEIHSTHRADAHPQITVHSVGLQEFAITGSNFHPSRGVLLRSVSEPRF